MALDYNWQLDDSQQDEEIAVGRARGGGRNFHFVFLVVRVIQKFVQSVYEDEPTHCLRQLQVRIYSLHKN